MFQELLKFFKISKFLGICSYGMHIFFIFVQFLVLHFGLAHSGSQPFISSTPLSLSPQRAVSCSVNFPVTEHIVNVEIAESVSSVITANPSDVIVVTLGPINFPLLAVDAMYVISVTASTAITSRMSDAFQVCESAR